MRKVLLIVVTVAALSIPGMVLAAGSHDNGCTDCHSIHDTQGPAAFAVTPNAVETYSHSGKTVGGVDALCLGCHNDEEGIIPIGLMKSHPVGLAPQKANVPAELLSDNGTLGCTSCHNPHPSNANYMYLVEPTVGGGKMGAFCAKCHDAQVDKSEL
jgi:predicted CXXCH cytochrome family protein